MPDDLPAGPDPVPEPVADEPSNRDIMSYLRTHLPGSSSPGVVTDDDEPGQSPEMTFEGDPEPIIEATPERPPGTVEEAPTLAQRRRGFPSRRTHGVDR